MAERQSGGRGRLGRRWRSAPGNLCASTVVRPWTGDPPATGLALVAGVALTEAVALFAPAGAPLQLKWPNDLLLDGAKCAGILLERASDRVVVGVGVNLAHAPTVPDRTTACLADLAPPPAPLALAEALAERFAHWLSRWRSDGVGPVRAAWLALAHPLGTALTIAETGQTGLFAGLAEDGALRLRFRDGGIDTVRAGDVMVAG